MASRDPDHRDRSAAGRGRLTARPLPTEHSPEVGPGLRPLGRGGKRDGLLLVPRSYGHDRPAPLLLLLHGAGGEGRQMLEHLAERAESRGFLILAPDSRGSTWDVLLGGYGPDVWFIDEALGHVFARYAVNRHRIGIGGFSDGASYALSLGIANGTLFSDILAFSPGFAAAQQATGLPQIFVSHGVTDDVLPIYREFPDGHIVPDAMVDAALDRFLA